MTEILVVEDNRTQARHIVLHLRQVEEFRVMMVNDAELVDRTFEEHPADVVLVDLYLDQESGSIGLYPSGIRVIASLRGVSREAVLVLYSSEFVGNWQETHRKLVESAGQAGADDVIGRKDLLEASPAELVKRVEDWRTVRRTTLVSNRATEYSDDLRTQAAVEAVSRSTIEGMLRGLLPDAMSDRLTALTAGFSGAYVFRVESLPRQKGVGKLRNVLKVSREAAALADELRARPLPGAPDTFTTVAGYSEGVIQHDGWSGMLQPEVTGHRLLRDYLLGGAANPRTARLLDRMLGRLFMERAMHAERIVAAASEAEDPPFLFRPAFSVQILQSLESLRRAGSYIGARNVAMIETLESFLNSALSTGWNPLPNSRAMALLHGDMHSRNIFVADAAEPLVIDLARRDWYPRLFDFAALETDLLLTVLDADGGLEHDIRRVPRWYGVASAGFPYSVKSLPPAASRTLQLLFLGRHKVQALADVSANEYAEALLFQSLRYVRFPSVTLAKKLLAVRLCNALLRRLALV